MENLQGEEGVTCLVLSLGHWPCATPPPSCLVTLIIRPCGGSPQVERPPHHDDDLDEEDEEVCGQPPVSLLDDDVEDWLAEEAGDAWAGLLVPGLLAVRTPLSDGGGARVPSKEFQWHRPTKRWREVVVEEHQPQGGTGGWQVVAVKCDCHRPEGCGRHCGHVFRVLDIVGCSIYRREWIHPLWWAVGDGGIQEEAAAPAPAAWTVSSRTRGQLCITTSSGEEDGDATSSVLVAELHDKVAKAWGHSLREVSIEVILVVVLQVLCPPPHYSSSYSIASPHGPSVGKQRPFRFVMALC